MIGDLFGVAGLIKKNVEETSFLLGWVGGQCGRGEAVWTIDVNWMYIADLHLSYTHRSLAFHYKVVEVVVVLDDRIIAVSLMLHRQSSLEMGSPPVLELALQEAPKRGCRRGPPK